MTEFHVNRNVGRAGQSLADGQVATTTGTVYTSQDVYTMIRSWCFFNTNAITQTLNIYMTRSGGTRRQLYQVSLNQFQSFDIDTAGEVLCMSPGDILEADTTTATAVDYMITGQTEENAG